MELEFWYLEFAIWCLVPAAMSHAKLFLLAALSLGAGCISHQDTTYRDVPRAPVEFENEAAGRIFMKR